MGAAMIKYKTQRGMLLHKEKRLSSIRFDRQMSKINNELKAYLDNSDSIKINSDFWVYLITGVVATVSFYLVSSIVFQDYERFSHALLMTPIAGPFLWLLYGKD